jgi:hypothetical protein
MKARVLHLAMEPDLAVLEILEVEEEADDNDDDVDDDDDDQLEEEESEETEGDDTPSHEDLLGEQDAEEEDITCGATTADQRDLAAWEQLVEPLQLTKELPQIQQQLQVCLLE